MPTEVFLSATMDGMPQDCVINLDHLQTVAKGKIGAFITSLSRHKLTELRTALLFALGF
ncbi:MAG TPA: type II toxin-antitoxin system PemK/MazF family toxin [Acidobacteriota bacterium]